MSDESTSREKIASFYDDHSRQMLRDYVNGNIRVSAALELIKQSLCGTKGRILDIGCGIGISSNAMETALPSASVLGIDISPKSIAIANDLFGSERVSFEVADMSEAPSGGPFSAITMIDVYEHVPRIKWPELNDLLSNCLTPDGVVILTTPTPYYQHFLKLHKPEALQIVDEAVELVDVMELARSIGGTLTHYSFKQIWQTNQYLHARIERQPKLEKPTYVQTGSFKRKVLNKIQAQLEIWNQNAGIRKRRHHVSQRLGVNVDA